MTSSATRATGVTGSSRTVTEPITEVAREATAIGLRSKRRQFSSGRQQGGGPLSTGQIHKILTNPVYRGQIRHRDRIWPGRHPAIVGEALWESMQEKLQSASRRPRGRSAEAAAAPLTGKLRDETGDRLTPTHSVKSGRRHAYYISNRLVTGGPDPTGWRLAAERLEALGARVIADHVAQAAAARRSLASPDLRSNPDLLEAAGHLAQAIRAEEPDLLRRILVRGTLAPGKITLDLDPATLADALNLPADALSPDLPQVSASLQLRRRGVEAKLVLGTPAPVPDPILLRTLAGAHRWVAALRRGTPLARIAHGSGHHDALIRTRAPLAFLSPKMQLAVRDGTLPPEITLHRIMQRPIPLDWQEQERLYAL